MSTACPTRAPLLLPAHLLLRLVYKFFAQSEHEFGTFDLQLNLILSSSMRNSICSPVHVVSRFRDIQCKTLCLVVLKLINHSNQG